MVYARGVVKEAVKTGPIPEALRGGILANGVEYLKRNEK